MFANWKHKLPTREKIFASRWFKPFAHLFDKPEYWAFKRDKVALSVAIGLFCGMLPAPTQFFSALMMAYLLRTQLPIALFSTLYTNPLTLIPLYVAAYKLGSRLLYGTAAQAELVMPALGEPGFWADAGRWTLPIRPAAGLRHTHHGHYLCPRRLCAGANHLALAHQPQASPAQTPAAPKRKPQRLIPRCRQNANKPHLRAMPPLRYNAQIHKVCALHPRIRFRADMAAK
jgi:hypothetical protein